MDISKLPFNPRSKVKFILKNGKEVEVKTLFSPQDFLTEYMKRDKTMLFTKDKPIIFAFHGYPTLVHELTYYRNNRNMVVKGYNEEGTITTAFDMKVQNEIDRFNLVKTVLYKLPQYGSKYASIIQEMNDKLVEHKQYINENGVDLPEIEDWKW